MSTANDTIHLPQGTVCTIDAVGGSSPTTLADVTDITPGDDSFAQVLIRSLARSTKNKLPGVRDLGNCTVNLLLAKTEYLAIRTFYTGKTNVQFTIVGAPDLTGVSGTKVTAVLTGYLEKMPNFPPIKDDDNPVPYSFEMMVNGITVS